jgi:alpha-methylacyl-CoA racemase
VGPLQGVKVVELAGIGPGPFCGMALADMGATVVRVDRAASVRDVPPTRAWPEATGRGRQSVGVDLKHPDGVATVLRLVEQADALIEGFRPGVTERLGLGPDRCLAVNPRLVYGRMTGWGQDGPLAPTAGHDIDYIALSGVLHTIGRKGERPVPPLNLVGDFGGGGMLLAFGIVCGVLEARTSGRGQVVDAAMCEGAALLNAFVYGMLGSGMWNDERGTNLLDGAAPYYDTYETSDGKHVAVGAIEPQFYAALLDGLGLQASDLPDQDDRASWDALRERFAAVFRTRTRDEWERTFGGTDACVTPVLSLTEAPDHPHNRARGAFVEVGGVTVPAPAPRFSRTPPEISGPPAYPGQHTGDVLAAWGFDAAEVEALRASGAVK